jgi:hypothetical protein
VQAAPVSFNLQHLHKVPAVPMSLQLHLLTKPQQLDLSQYLLSLLELHSRRLYVHLYPMFNLMIGE